MFLLILFSGLSFQAFAQKLALYDLTTNHLVNPLGIAPRDVRISWKLNAVRRATMQTAYQVRVSKNINFDKSGMVWDSNRIRTDQSVLVRIPFPIMSATRYFWQVRVWDNHGNASGWSPVAFFETGLLPRDWTARWIFPPHDTSLLIPSVMVRKEFNCPDKISSARLYISSLGIYEATLNGTRVGDQLLTPGWTSYKKRLQYQVYDVTSMLAKGANAMGVTLGNGWFRSNLGWNANWGMWGKQLGLICELHIRFTDGSSKIITSDSTWKSNDNGPVRATGIYEGETYNARKEISNWNLAGFADAQWDDVAPGDYPAELVPTETVPVRAMQELKPVKILVTPKGTKVIDFGQNLVGWVRLSTKSPAGTVITVRHAEVLDKYGEFYTENLRQAKATMTYITKGGGVEVYEPKYTFFGFRYIAVDGYAGTMTPENFTAIVVHSDMDQTGEFECSNPLVNQLQKNILWGQRGNFVDVPTDCPQRDERLGWTGDAQVFARTAAYNMDVAAFFTKWLKDLAADQGPTGVVPSVIPNVLGENDGGSAGWADAATIIPWEMYRVYGDSAFLRAQYPSMKALVGYMESKSIDHLWNTTWHFGDWLFYRPSDDLDGRAAVTDKHLISQCFYAHSTQLVVNAAEVLGYQDDVKAYREKLEKIKTAFLKEYVTPSGRLVSGTQTAYVLALQFDMLPEDLRPQAAERLAANVKSYDNHLTTGFLGTPHLCHVLTRYGYNDVAYSLLLQESYPSWLYPVKMGATTIWERWDGQKPDSTFQNPGMNSFNHYAYGAIGDWMYRVVAGIDLASPGYKEIKLHPQPDKRLAYARGKFETPYGAVKSSWERKGGEMIVRVEVPVNTTALLQLPGAELSSLRESNVPVQKQEDVRAIQENRDVVVRLGSGEYEFQYSTRE